jgi:hypothetical protein
MRLKVRCGNCVTSGTPGMKAPHCAGAAEALASRACARFDNRTGALAAADSASARPALRKLSGAVSATKVPLPTRECT